MDTMRRLILLAFAFIIVGLSGCELDSLTSEDKDSPSPDNTNVVMTSDGSVSGDDSTGTGGSGTGTGGTGTGTGGSGGTITDGSGSDGSYGSQDPPVKLDGTATLVVVNNKSYDFYPSLDDTTIGGELIKLSLVQVGKSRSYTIPAGTHWLMIYSAESGMQYEAHAYFTAQPDSKVTYYYDTRLHQ